MLIGSAAFVGCSQLVQYTDELTDSRTGRSAFVTTPATFGGVVGFVVGIPVDIVALPVTYAVYEIEKSKDPVRADMISSLLFPSFFLWRAGNLVGVPFDALEFGVYRAWRSPETMNRDEFEEVELRHDQAILPSYPVKPVYPDATWTQRRDAEHGA